MRLFDQQIRKNLSSGRLFRQIIGALLKRWWLVVLLILCLIPLTVPGFPLVPGSLFRQLLWLACLSVAVILIISVCRTLSDIFNLTRNENGITWCQILILIAIGLWIIGAVFILSIQADNKSTVVFGIIGSLLAWIFQDKIKGAAAFIHLRSHHLLNIDDWIRVPKYNVDGTIKRVTLTTVTVYNWDTTTSTIPLSALQADHFINLQNMSEGKTYGRRMLQSFILHTGGFHPITREEVAFFKSSPFSTAHQLNRYLKEDDIREGVLNAQLYRLYVYHWLMDHPHISQQPRLLVHWLDHSENGLTLQVDAFLIDTDWAAFDWQESQIMEHIIESLDWFGLKLYQRPSSYDLSKQS